MPPARASAHFRFYAELNDHLPPHRQYTTIEKHFFVPASVKDMIESFGVPHSEVDLILVNGESSDFSRLIRNDDRVAVFPIFESLDITPVLHLRPQPLREPKFVLDVHLGRLAGYLRMLGFDSAYANRITDPELVQISSEQKRVLLTRDRGVLKNSAVTHGYWIRETHSRRQAAEVVPLRSLPPHSPVLALHRLQSASPECTEVRYLHTGACRDFRTMRGVPGVHRLWPGLLEGLALRTNALMDWRAGERFPFAE